MIDATDMPGSPSVPTRWTDDEMCLSFLYVAPY